jgi:hypothetical protein
MKGKTQGKTLDQHASSIRNLSRQLAEARLKLDAFSAPVRSLVEADEFYAALDPGIAFAVRVLHANGYETCQSCQGGEGHSYNHPTVDMRARADDAEGFGALRALTDYGIEVRQLSLVWPTKNGLPYEKLWRIELWRPLHERVGEVPLFVWSYRAEDTKGGRR